MNRIENNEEMPKRMDPREVAILCFIATWLFLACLCLFICFGGFEKHNVDGEEIIDEPVGEVVEDTYISDEIIEEPEVEIIVPDRTVEEKIEDFIYIVEPETEDGVEDIESAPLLYTEDDAIALAKMVWGEARGVDDLTLSDGRVISGDCQRAATIWTVLNRYDAGYSKSIIGVVTAKGQFVGYKKSHPVTDEHLALAYDVLERWNAEKNGKTDVGRVLPADYFYFSSGGDGHNYFRNVYRGGGDAARWKWDLGDPYVKGE